MNKPAYLRKNKIFIPFGKLPIGGPMTFMRNLQNYLDDIGFPYAKSPLFAKGIFFPISYHLFIIKWIKFFGGKVIQRLDGVYYPSQHGDGFKIMNKGIERIYLNYTDFIIFQSEYSKKQCFAMMGEKKKEEYAIIHNGADKKIFYPSDDMRKIDGKIKFIMTGSFRKKVMIEPIVLALDDLRGRFDFELIVVGPVINKEIEDFFKRDYITMAGSKESKEVAEVLRNSHILIHSQLNDNCPNSVLEAISCGLPIVGFDSGAMKELLFFSPELLAPTNNEIFQKYEDLDWRELKEKILLAIENYAKFKQLAMGNSRLYSMEDCGKKYVEVFERIINSQ